MSAVKEAAIELIGRLPEESDWTEIAYRVYVRAKVEQGLADVREGRTIPHQQVMQEMEEWLASVGAPAREPTSSGS